MTYAEVLDSLIDIFKRHHMINTWGYGNLSDLVTPFKKKDIAVSNISGNRANPVYNIDYPYAFLQPTNHNLAKGKSTFSFNLIMMEQCEDNQYSIIKAQSNCYQYIQDVLAEIYYNYDQKFDFTLNSTVTPFKERYDDTVSGMTANISIEIPMVLDDCIAPFAPKYDDLVFYAGRSNEQDLRDGLTDPEWILAEDVFKQPSNWFTWNGDRALLVNATQSREFKVVLTGYARPVTPQFVPGSLAIVFEQGLSDQPYDMEMENWIDQNTTEFQRFSATVTTQFSATATGFRFGFRNYSTLQTSILFRDVEIKIFVQ